MQSGSSRVRVGQQVRLNMEVGFETLADGNRPEL